MTLRILHIAIIHLLILFSGICYGYEPVLKGAQQIMASSIPLDVGSYSVPNAYDWNNDGKKDLLVGQFLNGKVRLYLNSGTDASPIFTTFTFLQAGGADISVPYY
jgi:hypothetical protein